MPKPETRRDHKYLRVFGKLLHKPNLWALNRKSAPGAFAVGLSPLWCLPILFLAMLLCLRKGPLMAGSLFAVIWLSLLFHCLYMHQYAEKSQQIEFKAQIVS
ncbi:MAG TPA: hypothetical protein DDW91_18555, partial [Shewanella frigidimarina]|nr:hypothetical protein [Shewanella frigidimarina]